MDQVAKEVREMATLVRRGPVFFRVSREPNGATSQQARTWTPALDAWETEDEVVYSFDLPGIPEDKIAVELENGVLTVTADRERDSEVKQDGFYRYERRVGSFTRSITLPEGVTEDAVKASFANGVLEVRVRKPEEAKPRRIEIGVKSEKTIEGTATEA
jgi:HSP20 family protein